MRDLRSRDGAAPVLLGRRGRVLVNDTDYGLNASVWGTDHDKAVAVAERIESGNVNVNDTLAAAYASKGTPSGGSSSPGSVRGTATRAS